MRVLPVQWEQRVKALLGRRLWVRLPGRFWPCPLPGAWSVMVLVLAQVVWQPVRSRRGRLALQEGLRREGWPQVR